MLTYDSNAEAQRLADLLRAWLERNPGWAQVINQTTWLTQMRTAEEVAALLLDETELGEVRLAGFMGQPDGQIIVWAVEQAMPYPTNREFELLVKAVTVAADAKQRGQKKVAAYATAGALLIGVGLIIGR